MILQACKMTLQVCKTIIYLCKTILHPCKMVLQHPSAITKLVKTLGKDVIVGIRGVQ
jgi:hypothetical protein